jgi:hypothetical protein
LKRLSTVSPDMPLSINSISAIEMVMFCPTEKDTDLVVEIKGELQTWGKIYCGYRLWLNLERPKVSDYLIDIDESGKQYVTLSPSRGRSHSPTWILKA